MSKGYVKLYRSIWADDDFLDLTGEAQRLYMALISQENLSALGVLPLTLARWSNLCSDATPDETRAALIDLEAANFVLVDYDTEEVFVRSYIVHDEQYRNPNGMKCLATAYTKVSSRRLRKAIEVILATLGKTLPPPPTKGAKKAPSQAPSEAPSSGGAPGDASPLTASQPDSLTACNLTERRQAGSTSRGLSTDLPETAAAAVEILIQHRLATERIRYPGKYRKTLQQQIPAEHGDDLVAHLTEHPEATPSELAATVFGLTELDLMRARTA
jgi:hypothetical protein